MFDVWLDSKSPGSPWFGAERVILNPVVDGVFYHCVRHEGRAWAHYGRSSPASSSTRGCRGRRVDRRAEIGRPDVWAVIKASAERRLGQPLLKVYFFLAVFGVVVVAVSIVIMHL